MRQGKMLVIAMMVLYGVSALTGCSGGSSSGSSGYSQTGLTTFTGNFENKNFSGWKQEFPTKPADHSVPQIVTSPVRSGNYAIQFNLKYTDRWGDSCRCELALDSQPQFSENWYRFSIYIPNGYEKDLAYGEEIVAQWHNIPDSGESWMQPPLMLELGSSSEYKDQWVLRRFWDPNPNAELNTDRMEDIPLGSYLDDRGKWVDWIFHIKWGWTTDQNPILEVYKNSGSGFTKVVDRNGKPNTTNDKTGPYFKIGIYKPKWITATSSPTISTRQIYHDEVYIMDSNSSLQQMISLVK